MQPFWPECWDPEQWPQCKVKKRQSGLFSTVAVPVKDSFLLLCASNMFPLSATTPTSVYQRHKDPSSKGNVGKVIHLREKRQKTTKVNIWLMSSTNPHHGCPRLTSSFAWKASLPLWNMYSGKSERFSHQRKLWKRRLLFKRIYSLFRPKAVKWWTFFVTKIDHKVRELELVGETEGNKCGSLPQIERIRL